MDKDLLLNIFKIPSLSGSEDSMRSFITKFLDERKIPYEIDRYGNIFNTSYKNKVLLNAHMDTVQDSNDAKMAKFIRIRGSILKGYGVIGADDKCGIYIILELLKNRKFNFLFTVQEEVGCIGVQGFLGENKNKLKNVACALTLDRWGDKDILCVDNDYGTEKFQNKLSKIGKDFGYLPNQGLFCDADYLSEEVSSCNLAVGYYDHHTKQEYVDLKDLEKAKKYIQALVDNIDTRYDPPNKGYTYTNFPYHEYMDDYDLPRYHKSKKCFVTGKKSKNVYYLTSIGEYVSVEGARILLEEMEGVGLLFDIYNNGDFEKTEDIYFEDDEYLEDDFRRVLEKEV